MLDCQSLSGSELSSTFYWTALLVSFLLLWFRSWQSGVQEGSARARNPGTDAVYLALALLAVVAGRWPGLLIGHELNPDESQMLAQAMKFSQDLVPWRSVDSTTSGPLNSYVLMATVWTETTHAYLLARVVGLLCAFGIIIATYLTLKLIGGRRAARIGVLPLVAFFAFAAAPEFIHYSSEHVPAALLAAGTYCLVRAHRRTEWWSGALGGVLLGAVPFAKLQAGPVAAMLVVSFILVLKPWHARPAWRQVSGTVAGTMVVPALLLLPVIATGTFEHFWTSYIGASLSYADRMPIPLTVLSLLVELDASRAMLTGIALLLPAAAWSARTDRCAGLRRFVDPLLVTLLYLAVVIFVVLKPGRAYAHYWLLAVHPLTLFCGLVVAAIGEANDAARPMRRMGIVAATVVLLPFLLAVRPGKIPALADCHLAPQGPDELVSRLISEVGTGMDSMAVWGWAPRYYVETGIRHATRDSVGYCEIEGEVFRSYYHRRFLEDLEAAMPPLVVDATGPGNFKCRDRGGYGIRHIPEFARFMDANYRRAFEVERCGPRTTIYLRNDVEQESHVLWACPSPGGDIAYFTRAEPQRFGDAVVPLETELSAGWAPGDSDETIIEPPVPAPVFGSRAGSDSNRGVLRWRIEPRPGADHLLLPLVTGPDGTRNRAVVRDPSRPGSERTITLPHSRFLWALVELPIPPGATSVEVFVHDDGDGWGQWLAVTTPFWPPES